MVRSFWDCNICWALGAMRFEGEKQRQSEVEKTLHLGIFSLGIFFYSVLIKFVFNRVPTINHRIKSCNYVHIFGNLKLGERSGRVQRNCVLPENIKFSAVDEWWAIIIDAVESCTVRNNFLGKRSWRVYFYLKEKSYCYHARTKYGKILRSELMCNIPDPSGPGNMFGKALNGSGFFRRILSP